MKNTTIENDKGKRYAVIAITSYLLLIVGWTDAIFGSLIEPLEEWYDLVGSMTTLYCAGALIDAFKPIFPAYVFGVYLMGVGTGSMQTSATAVLSHFEDGPLMTLVYSNMALGSVISPFIIGAFLQYDIGWHHNFWILVGFAAILIISSWFIFKNFDTHDTEKDDYTLREKLRIILPSKKLWIGLLAEAGLLTTQDSFSQWIAPYVKDLKGLSNGQPQYAVAGFWGGLMVGRLLLAHGSAKIAGLWKVNSLGGTVTLVILIGFFFGPLMPNTLSIGVECWSRELKNAATSIIMATSLFGSLLAPFALSQAADEFSLKIFPPVLIVECFITAIIVSFTFVTRPIKEEEDILNYKSTKPESCTNSANPNDWGARNWQSEPDDYLHNPTTKDGSKASTGSIFTVRGFINLGFLSLVITALLMLFAGYPIYDEFKPNTHTPSGQYAKFNSTGQVEWTVPDRNLIDRDTPKDAYVRSSGFGTDNREYKLVFSDEFSQDGRSFYEGDDPYWEAHDAHYWGTNNLEWYSPRQVTTEGGNLLITLDQSGDDDDLTSHNLDYTGGFLTTWNKFCFTGGYVVANVSLPGKSDVWGLWPGFWTMGNLGRAAYGASLEGLWPYSYDTCDVGTLQNQTLGEYPDAAYNQGGDPSTAALSYSAGQRLSRCTCENEDHPGPKHPDGTFKGRSAFEIDIFEAQVSQENAVGGHGGTGTVSMSGQFCPFDLGYQWNHDAIHITYDETRGPNDMFDMLNTYQGGNQQMSTSVVVMTDQEAYQMSGGKFSEYGLQITPGTGHEASIAWTVNDELRWQVFGDALGGNETIKISERPITDEPMYVILQLGISYNFGAISDEVLNGAWPNIMKVDWVRVYQPSDSINIGCDPPEMPTAAYINRHIEAYSNANLTTWNQYMEKAPDVAKPVKNALLHQDDADCKIALHSTPDKNLIGMTETDEKKRNHWN
ncbi:glycoside hydrolase family 16 protein [Wallemia mellicola]|uniref:Glycoside hydrolase family 16 protein n=1 Tax=Wallemia mellicola TaxID=1708541 RepID=A0AB74KFF4_9BASI|nr:hypothetical protein E3Q24_01437 [Wallemia mellicola]TIC06215.1 glycoside hydrolase family 16 protein [Wallemia mellicola]TIC68891.1 glycoside hydrolase family 16 protein [Wallemia mellicola]